MQPNMGAYNTGMMQPGMMQPGMGGMGMAGGANPFMTGNPAAMGMGGGNPFFQDAYVNPDHNKPLYTDSGVNMNNAGPSAESWMRDNGTIAPGKKDNDNIKEF